MPGYKTLLSLIFVYIAPFAHAGDLEVVFDQPVQLFQPSADGLGTPSPLAPNTPVALLKDQVYWVQAKGRVPVLVLPQVAEKLKAPLKISLPDVTEWPAEKVQREMDDKLSQLMVDLTVFQDALRRKDVESAERSLARMEAMGRLDYLHFLRASVRFIKGDVDGAKESTRRGLSRYPSNEQGQRFLQKLEGSSR